LVFALGVVASVVPFVWPRVNTPNRADAVIVLSGDHGERLPRALRLIEQGVARTLVFDGTIDRAEEDQFCRDGWRGVEVICLRPEPDSTQAEARAAASLARERGWRHVVVVTTSYHVTRAELLFRRCLDGEVSAVAGPPVVGGGTVVRMIAREWLATAYFLFLERKC
jgi:uncharacterized SAM-binding protein YcdF (DUF218 family)